MKLFLTSLAVCACAFGAAAQSYEPQFNQEVRVLVVNGCDSLSKAPEVTNGIVKTKKKGGNLLGKIAQGASAAANGLSYGSTNSDVTRGAWAASSVANVASNISYMNGGGGSSVAVPTSFSLNNPTSPCKVPAGSEVLLVIKMTDNSQNPSKLFQILPLEKKKKERQYKLGESASGNGTVMTNTVPFTGERYGETSYLLHFTAQPGEYALYLGDPNLELHCFSIGE